MSMEPFKNGNSPALRLARLYLELSCLDSSLAAERRRARRELDSPLVDPRITRRVEFHESHCFN